MENIDGKLAVPFGVDYLLGGLCDGIANFRRKAAQAHVGQRGVFFDQAQSADKRARKTQIADGKILDGPGGLGAVIGVCRHLHCPHRIHFSPECVAHNRKGISFLVNFRGLGWIATFLFCIYAGAAK